jgi:hypothetical protein
MYKFELLLDGYCYIGYKIKIQYIFKNSLRYNVYYKEAYLHDYEYYF